MSEVADRSGFEPVATPLLEPGGLFDRLGAASDVVAKEMYRVDDGLVCRPEGTAGVARAFGAGGRQRLSYAGEMFRRERPQAGRLRQFTQFGFEDLNSTSAAADAEACLLAVRCVEAAGVTVSVRLGQVGCAQCRPPVLAELSAWADRNAAALCPLCVDRAGRNPLRVLDCFECAPVTSDAPTPAGGACSACRARFELVAGALEDAGCVWETSDRLVRGLDYYVGVVFELFSPGVRGAVGGGGRYGTLEGTQGGVGAAIGVERVELALDATAGDTGVEPRRGLGVVALPGCERQVVALADRLRTAGRVVLEAEGRGVRAALRQLERARVAASVVVGEAELTGVAELCVRWLDDGSEQAVRFDDAALADLVRAAR